MYLPMVGSMYNKSIHINHWNTALTKITVG